MSWGEIAEYYIDDSDYPVDALGAKKIIVDSSLDTYRTQTNFPDLSISGTVQSVAHAGCAQLYIDRLGYLHLDNVPENGDPSQYHLTLAEQLENGTFSKIKSAGKVTVSINTTVTSIRDAESTIIEGGEDLTIDNKFIETTPQAEALLERTKTYLAKRNTAEIPYRGEPALDILDRILFDTEYSTDIVATVIGTDLTYDGSLTGKLTLLYSSEVSDSSSISITGAENFVYASGASVSVPSSVTLTCVTDSVDPTYQWSYYNTSVGWVTMVGETNSTLTIVPTGGYFTASDITVFRVTLGNGKSSNVRIRRVQATETTINKYLGILGAIPDAYTEGDYFLCSPSFGTYTLGNVYQYDGTDWVLTTNATIIASVVSDARSLDMPYDNTSAVNNYIVSVTPRSLTLTASSNVIT